MTGWLKKDYLKMRNNDEHPLLLGMNGEWRKLQNEEKEIEGTKMRRKTLYYV